MTPNMEKYSVGLAMQWQTSKELITVKKRSYTSL